ncbi:acetyl-CoA carboxylase biotin carboxylase subunit family protein [uncultured Robinsoniella sp.]|uniref:ATP-grasp domain-containing protein n=1 Tax=uncultured Robinsoniella sp. TaxID=904190 RepID=UPI00374FC9D7
MKKIVIIGANDFQNPLILKAREMGYQTHVFAWKEGAVGEQTADYFYPVSIVEKEEILKECKKIMPDAVASIGSDLANITVQYLAVRLGLCTNSDNCILYSTNKFEMRSAFVRNHISAPLFTVVDETRKIELPRNMTFPIIVKPTDRSGSRAITKVFKEEELDMAVEAAIANSFEKKAILEEYIDGEEFSCEGISYEGRHTFLAITRKYTTGAPHFIETGHMEPSGLSPEMEARVFHELGMALNALEIRNGASHSEFRINSRLEVKIIEIGSRMGGDCIGSHLVPLSTGQDYLKMVIQTALGENPEILKEPLHHFARIQFVFGAGDMEKYRNIKEKYPENLVFTSEIGEIGSREVIDSGSRFGFYIIKTGDLTQMQEIEGILAPGFNQN